MNSLRALKNRAPEILLFLGILLSRLLWVRFSGLKPMGFQDAAEYVELSERALRGNFDFDLYRFIRPPGYPVVIALTKLVFGAHRDLALQLLNVLFFQPAQVRSPIS